MTDAGLSGIECIATLEELSLGGCEKVTSVTRLATSKSLKKLDLYGTSWKHSGVFQDRTVLMLEVPLANSPRNPLQVITLQERLGNGVKRTFFLEMENESVGQKLFVSDSLETFWSISRPYRIDVGARFRNLLLRVCVDVRRGVILKIIF